MSDPSSPSEQPRPTNPHNTSGDDPLAGLFRMSRTAGLGSTDYVAVNNAAVVALVLGLASFFVRLGWPLLLIPLAGVVTAAVAIRQIVGSSGTQKGTWLAVLGLMLSLAFGGWFAASKIAERRQEQVDRGLIAAELTRVGDQIRNKDLAGAYASMSPRLKERFDEATFKNLLWFLPGTDRDGRLQSTAPGNQVFLTRDRADGKLQATTALSFVYDVRDEETRATVVLVKEEGKWMIDELPELLRERERQGAAGDE